MDTSRFISEKVRGYYWNDDVNCATTMLKILAELNDVVLADQTVDAAAGLHGAGGYGAQCGLVEGGLMFIGIRGQQRGMAPPAIAQACQAYARAFEERFGSLQCRVLRPQRFGAHQPPHLCEGLTREAAGFAVAFLGPEAPVGIV